MSLTANQARIMAIGGPLLSVAIAIGASDFGDRTFERFDIGAQGFAIANEVAAVGIDKHAQCLRLRLRRLTVRAWQFQPQYRARIEGGGDHEENEQGQHDVDQRDHVDLGFVILAVVADTHVRPDLRQPAE